MSYQFPGSPLWTRVLALVLALATVPVFVGGAAQSPSLKIVVLEGEDAVNIIDKKTAVKPTVEVRDQNDLPVSGASVVFLIQGGRNSATFAEGLRQVTLTTNSLGRATVSELTPLGKGAFQIQVRAMFQGQTATATIHQANFATAAAAQAAGKAPLQSGSSGGSGASTSTAAAAGGGLSHAAIAGIVAGAAGAATTVGVIAAKHSNTAPTVGTVSASPTSTLVGTNTSVSFSAQASDKESDPLTFSWDFGDGGTGTGSTATHVYTSAGTFTARVSVSDGKSSSSGQTTGNVKTLTGTWVSTTTSSAIGPIQWTITLTQSGSSVVGTTPTVNGNTGALVFLPGTLSGTVGTGSPHINLTLKLPPSGGITWNDSFFALDPSSDADTLTGNWGTPNPLTFTRR